MSLKDFFSRKNTDKSSPPQEPVGCLSLKDETFAGLIQMFYGQDGSGGKAREGSLPALLHKAREDRTAKNVHAVTFELFRILRPYQIHFMAGGEDLYDDCVRKMKTLAEEAADMGDANACNLAGIINANTWGFKGGAMHSADGEIDLGYKERAPASAADLPVALKWFEKGAALGGESEIGRVSHANAEMARVKIAAAQNDSHLRPEPPTPG